MRETFEPQENRSEQEPKRPFVVIDPSTMENQGVIFTGLASNTEEIASLLKNERGIDLDSHPELLILDEVADDSESLAA